MNNTVLWSTGSLIALFQGKLIPDQIYVLLERVVLISKTSPAVALSSDGVAIVVASRLVPENSL
jgi:hypothetical protein